jgi:hypothetical protein
VQGDLAQGRIGALHRHDDTAFDELAGGIEADFNVIRESVVTGLIIDLIETEISRPARFPGVEENLVAVQIGRLGTGSIILRSQPTK